MPNQIFNTASLTFEYGSQIGYASSNTSTTALHEAISMSKISLGSSYYLNENIFYTIAVTNNNSSEISNVRITDDLGSYSPDNYSVTAALFTPLTYSGPANLYIGGIFYSEIEPEVYKEKVIFSISSIPARSNALITYKVSVNDCAPLAKGSEITNTATLSLENITDPVTASDVLTVAETAKVKIIKDTHPESILKGEIITYNFSLYNYGNTEALNVVFNNTFSPAPTNINVTVGSENISPLNYSYINDTLTMPAYGSGFSISIPAAEFDRNPTTGAVSVTPGITTITITGQI